MNNSKFGFYFILLISISSFYCDDEINVMDYQDLIESRPEEIQDKCETDEMAAYSLIADAKSLSETNRLCPNIAENCCGEVDQENIEKLWERDSERIQKYTTHNLKILRYVLGYGEHYYKLARVIADDYKRKTAESKGLSHLQTSEEDASEYVLRTNQYCFNAAEYVLSKSFSDQTAIEILYHNINQKAEFLHNVRATFYCSLCSVRGQQSFSTYRMISSASNINYSQDFCKTIVAHTLSTTYELYDNYSEYFSNVIKMMTCVEVPSEKESENEHLVGEKNFDSEDDFESKYPPYELSEGLQSIIKNPLGMSDFGSTEACNTVGLDSSVWFAPCEFYCQKFKIAKADSFFDYDADQLKIVFDYMKQYEPVLPDGADFNLFNDDMITLKKEIEELYFKIPYNGLFFISKNDSIDFSTFSTDFSRLESYNPMEEAEGHLLTFNYENVNLASAVICFVLTFLFLA